MFFLALSLLNLCRAVRLNPLENNDKLQDINNQFVAEWQWESWPIKQEPTENDGRSPGSRVNVALWMEESGSNWYLFGGQPVNTEVKKAYSDVWKYSVSTRLWERFFPSQGEIKGANTAKIGGMMTLRANLFNEGHTLDSEPKVQNVILCGGVVKTNITKTKNQNFWSNFTRKKKQEQEIRELRSLAVYAPKTSKSNTVWQIDMKDKLWTAYVCCCDTNNGGKRSTTIKQSKSVVTDNREKTEATSVGLILENTQPPGNLNTDTMEDEKSNLINKKKKINQNKKPTENVDGKVKEQEKRSGSHRENSTSIAVTRESATTEAMDTTRQLNMTKKEKYNLKLKEMDRVNKTEVMGKMNNMSKTEAVLKPKVASKYCPEFSEEVEPVTWCDGNNEVLITTDISSPEVVLWIFNLKTSHWSQKAVKISSDVDWPGCSALDSARYAGSEAEVFIVCSPHSSYPGEVDRNSTAPPKNPSKGNSAIKIVFQINYKNQLLTSLGEIELSSYFTTSEGQDTWENETKSLLQVVRTPQNETILLLAYQDFVDIWILTTTSEGRQHFDVVEKIWRGSALKWFNKYNSPLYNFQFTAETGGSAKTILLPNPRMIGLTEYWPRDRGRFIIRVFKNENLKNRTFENRTREQNLTYELLQSDYKPNGGAKSVQVQMGHTYSFKVLVFFGISLAMFTAFGVVIFLKRCVTCPPKIRIRNEIQKSPLVIRYSVIPDDLLYPIT
ncbi:hypothetical protein RUM43_014003 [Polyplax serrata]|uniref:Uncharacterized protein n=1 Tax=Polyplax serrata TaxID=468196 RepID=A0AAN8S6V4_POLSC